MGRASHHLDRLARNVHFISSLMESGVDFIACDFPEANRLTVNILAAFAEHEAAMISSRTKAALAAAKARGTALGGLRGPRERMASMEAKGTRASAAVRRDSASKRRADLLPVIAELKSKGAAFPTGTCERVEWGGTNHCPGWTMDGNAGDADACVIRTVPPFNYLGHRCGSRYRRSAVD